MSAPRVTGRQEITGLQALPASLRAASRAVFITPTQVRHSARPSE